MPDVQLAAVRVCVHYGRLPPQHDRLTTTSVDLTTCRSCLSLLRKHPQLRQRAIAWRQPTLPLADTGS